jgi:battenin
LIHLFNFRTRITISCCAAVGGFVVVAYAREEWMALTGVALTSFGSGLGEPTFLAYSAFFHHNVISTWSSGTGGKCHSKFIKNFYY